MPAPPRARCQSPRSLTADEKRAPAELVVRRWPTGRSECTKRLPSRRSLAGPESGSDDAALRPRGEPSITSLSSTVVIYFRARTRDHGRGDVRTRGRPPGLGQRRRRRRPCRRCGSGARPTRRWHLWGHATAGAARPQRAAAPASADHGQAATAGSRYRRRNGRHRHIAERRDADAAGRRDVLHAARHSSADGRLHVRCAVHATRLHGLRPAAFRSWARCARPPACRASTRSPTSRRARARPRPRSHCAS